MTSRTNPSSLMFLGRRIERMLYVGIVLLILCFVELYLVSASVYFGAEGRMGEAALLTRIEENKERLSSLFQSLQSPQERKLLAKNEQRVAETRRKLGLPPKLVPDSTVEVETYGHALSAIITDVARDTGAHPGILGKSIDISKPPEVLIKNLHDLQKGLEKKSTTVWGIETPSLFSIQYSGIDYRIPTNFLASTLVATLAPLLIGWLGSLYLTRQRELLAISELHDYKLAFPHILNLMPIMFTQYEKVYGAIYFSKEKRFQRVTNRIMLSIFRSLLILVFAGPMVTIVLYSVYQLLNQLVGGLFTLNVGITVILALILLNQSLSLVVQEWTLAYRKQFYE